VLAISSYSNDAGAAVAFRNVAPAGFFDNLLLPRLIEATGWLLSPSEPFVGLQLSHAPMTAVVRLDGDQSDVPASTTTSLDYLVKLGRETGITTMYAIVSSFAQRVGWEGFLPLTPEIERLGGAIASHSHTHNQDMSGQLTDPDWKVEISDSEDLIRSHFTTATFHPPVRVFVNPGAGIEWADYRRFFGDINTYATHGYELSVPYTTGISGFDLPANTAPVALLGNTAVPDVQWLYDPGWTYTVTEATQYQKQILAYYQNRIGRGALYNQMWHDYAIANAAPLHYPSQTNVRPLFDANRDHFAKERVYAPAIQELTTKLHLAERTSITAQTNGPTVTTTLDLSRLTSAARAHLSGMGLRLNRTDKPIVSVAIDGTPHPAFTADTVILPPTQASSIVVTVETGDPAAVTSPRLTYISKAYGALAPSSDSLHVELATPGLHTRFCLSLPQEHVVLGADRYAPDGAETCGTIDYGSTGAGFEAKNLVGPHGLSIFASERRLSSIQYTKDEVVLSVAPGPANGHVSFRSTQPPVAVRVDAVPVTTTTLGDHAYQIELPSDAASTIEIDLASSPTTPTTPDPPSSTNAPNDAPPAGGSDVREARDGGSAADGCSASPGSTTSSGGFLGVLFGVSLLRLRRRR
jgi:hypothetical protein